MSLTNAMVGISIELELGPETLARIDRIADEIKRASWIVSAARFTFQLNLGELETMPVYKADKPDFDTRVKIKAVDSEGNVIEDAPIPAGHTLTVESDNPACFQVQQDAADPKLLHNHVGGPEVDGTPSQANVVARLTDPAGNLVSTGAKLVTVTVGDPSEITEIAIELPEE